MAALLLAGLAGPAASAGERPKAPWPCRYHLEWLEPPPVCGGQPPEGQAKAINQAGDVAGDAFVCSALNLRPFIWTAGSGFQIQPAAPTGGLSAVADMNNNGDLCGTGANAFYCRRLEAKVQRHTR